MYSCFREVNWKYWWLEQDKVNIYKDQNYVANGEYISAVFGWHVLSMTGLLSVLFRVSASNWVYLYLVT